MSELWDTRASQVYTMLPRSRMVLSSCTLRSPVALSLPSTLEGLSLTKSGKLHRAAPDEVSI